MPGWDEHPHAGHSNGDPFEMPADLAAVQADDALLDMIGAGYAPTDTDDELTRVLAAWRHEVHAEPVKELVDTSTALALIRAAARQPARRRSPVFGSIAGAAAVVVIAFSSVGLVAKSAEPGDPLWRVTEVLYSEYAESVETAAAIETELNEANMALKQGDQKRAREALQDVQLKLPAVGDGEGRTQLTTRHQELAQQLPPEPLPPRAQSTTPLAPAGPAPQDGKPDKPGVPSPEGSTTSPGSESELRDRRSTTSSDHFPPGMRDPRSYYESPGHPGYPGPGDRDFRPPTRNDPSADRNPDDPQPSVDTKPDSTAPVPSPSPSPSPSPAPEGGSSIGAGSGTDQPSAPPPHNHDFPFANGPSSGGASVTESVQPPFSASTASA